MIEVIGCLVMLAATAIYTAIEIALMGAVGLCRFIGSLSKGDTPLAPPKRKIANRS